MIDPTKLYMRIYTIAGTAFFMLAGLGIAGVIIGVIIKFFIWIYKHH
jgi:hypothetical protein